MIRMMKCSTCVLAICLMATVAVGDEGEKKDGQKGIIAVYTFDGPILEKPRGARSFHCLPRSPRRR
jgi:hypothetical protein